MFCDFVVVVVVGHICIDTLAVFIVCVFTHKRKSLCSISSQKKRANMVQAFTIAGISLNVEGACGDLHVSVCIANSYLVSYAYCFLSFDLFWQFP